MGPRSSKLLAAFFVLLLSFPAFAVEPAQWVLVTAPAFRSELTPLIDHRRAEGLKVVVIETTEVLSAEQIQNGDGAPLQRRLAELVSDAATNYVLLAGAVTAGNPTNALSFVVPPLRGTIGRMKGQPGDYGYCLPDTNGAPTVAVGRLPAQSTREMRGMVEKVLQFERDREPAPWQSRLLLLAGESGAGTFADLMLENVVAPRLERLHPSWSLRALFAS